MNMSEITGNTTIDKPTIFVTSLGRTGTLFFARLFEHILHSCQAFHEPDVLNLNDPLPRIKHFGLMRMTIGKFSPMSSVRRLSVMRQAGQIGEYRAARCIFGMRKNFVDSVGADVYAESNNQLLALADLLPRVFASCRVVIILRDGRDWITSINRQRGRKTFLDKIIHLKREGYGYFHYIYHCFLGRISPLLLPQDKWKSRWKDFDVFQKLCWYWQFQYRYALARCKDLDNVKIVKYEDVFLSDEKYRRLKEIIDFITRFPDYSEFPYRSFENALDRRVHASDKTGFPGWRDWSDERVVQFEEICGDLMAELGYGREPQWRERCRKLKI